MTATHQLPVFNIDQAAVYRLLTDPVSGTATYGPKQLVPGIRNVAFGLDTLNKENYGDGAVLALASKIRKATATFTYAFLDFDVLNIIAGSAVTDTGTDPNSVATQDTTQADIPNYFKCEFRILQVGDAPGSSLNVSLWKCKLTDHTPGLAGQEDFAPQTFVVSAIPRRSDGKIYSKVSNTTAVALSA